MLASDFSQKGLIGLGTGHPFWQLQTYGHQIFAQGLKLEHIRGFVQAVKRATVVGFDKGCSTDVGVDQGADNRLAVVNESITLQEMVNGLNALGIGPRDMITILQAIKAAGAMQASIEVM